MINCFIYKLQDERSEGSRLARTQLKSLLGCDMLILKVDKTLGRNLSVALLMMQR